MIMLHCVKRAALVLVTWSVVAVWFCGTFATAQNQVTKNSKFPQQILIIRHAEKTGEAADTHLSKQGKDRAVALDRLFIASDSRPAQFPMPDFIFAASESKNSNRSVETIEPLAARLKLTINKTYDSKRSSAQSGDGKDQPDSASGMLALRDEVFGNPKYIGKTLLVSWRHSTIPDLARALKAGNVPGKWADEVFDRVWVITYNDDGTAMFSDRPQRLMAGDAKE